MSSPLARLAELGVEMPAVAAPLAAYLPAVRSGSLVFTSGQLPMVGGALLVTGKVGGDVSPDAAMGLTRICALNGLAAVHARSAVGVAALPLDAPVEVELVVEVR